MKNRLKELRTKHKLTLEKMSSQLEIPINTLSRYERGEREPKLETWKKLAKFFDVSTAYLIGIDDEVDSHFIINELDKRNTQMIKEICSLMKEIMLLCNKYPDAHTELGRFEEENGITDGFISGLRDDEGEEQ